MLALAELEADTCGGCGGRLSETTEQEHGVSTRIYEVQPPATCARCVVMDVAHKRVEDHDHPRALRFSVTETPRPRREVVTEGG